jgi:transcriptional regulator with GAF, ATPase, and Fis domain
MEPRLVVVSGTKKNTIITLADGDVTIGRDAGNSLCLGEDAVSRKHCTIKKDGESYRIVDFNSRNGTFVNGIPVRQKVLQHGNMVRLGYSEFLFLAEGDEIETPTKQSEDDAELPVTDRTLILSPADRRRVLGSDLPDIGAMVRDLNAFLKISSRISGICKTDLLLREFLELMFEVTPAEHASVVLTSGADDAGTVTSLRRNGSKGSPDDVNRKLVNRALWENTRLVNEPQGTKAADGLALCVPLSAMKKTLGAIYLATPPNVVFEENHVNFISAVTGIFAVALENAAHLESLEGENSRLRSEIELEHNMVGESAAMDDIMQFVARVAPSDSTVLIRGESGTGKEVVARAIHRNSRRKNNPFVAINCAAITETLLESELFGHERGAFTGATAMKKGRLEVASTGTLFLDEIGEMPPILQAKLLRVLQNREFERVGGTRPIKVDVRFLAATNRNLEEAMKIGAFRQDLFYRLNVVSITMPPLRQHREDIPLLAMYFAAEYSAKCKRPLKGVSPEARALLMSYSWPGNVRELENAIERAVVLGIGNTIVPEDLPEALLEGEVETGSGSKYHQSLNALKKQLIVEAVERSGGMITEAAKLLGVHPNYLHRLIRNLNLRGLITRDMKNPAGAA